MRLFRRKPAPLESVRLGELSEDPADYSVLTVGQSRLSASFESLQFRADSEPRNIWATLLPTWDRRMNVIADISILVDGTAVGYLRPPALDEAIALLDKHNARSLQVPARLSWGAIGPDVAIRL